MNMKYKKCYTEDIWTPDHFKMDMTNWFHDISQSKTCCGSLQGRDGRDSHEKFSSANWQIQNKETSNNSIATTISPNESMNSEIIPSCICSNSMEFCSPTNQSNIIRTNDACTCCLSVTSSNSEAFTCPSESTGENIVTNKLHDNCEECLGNKSRASVVTQRKQMPEEDRLSEFDEYCQYKDWEKIYKIFMGVKRKGEKLTDKSNDHYIPRCNDDLSRPHRENEMHEDLNDNIFVNMNRPKIIHGHCMFHKECICQGKEWLLICERPYKLLTVQIRTSVSETVGALHLQHTAARGLITHCLHEQ